MISVFFQLNPSPNPIPFNESFKIYMFASTCDTLGMTSNNYCCFGSFDRERIKYPVRGCEVMPERRRACFVVNAQWCRLPTATATPSPTVAVLKTTTGSKGKQCPFSSIRPSSTTGYKHKQCFSQDVVLEPGWVLLLD